MGDIYFQISLGKDVTLLEIYFAILIISGFYIVNK